MYSIQKVSAIIPAGNPSEGVDVFIDRMVGALKHTIYMKSLCRFGWSGWLCIYIDISDDVNGVAYE